jgi:hypothetical protein
MHELLSRRRFLKQAAIAGGGALLGTVSLNQISPRIWREPLVFARNRSYWARTQLPENPPLTANIAADFATPEFSLSKFVQGELLQPALHDFT